MDFALGALAVLAVAVALYFLFRRIFVKKNQQTTSGRMASDEVLKKEVHHFDTKTGGEKGTGPEGVQREKADDNKEIR
ncbi:MAG TPA: hypothetical protein VK014_01185 [Cyclobacteriaceae bacterium]|nr:hypothetical protein [Cyclobacteriaceae bacterium]